MVTVPRQRAQGRHADGLQHVMPQAHHLRGLRTRRLKPRRAIARAYGVAPHCPGTLAREDSQN
ncbi:hypothetical protein [Rhizobium rhizosphaerae]|uniref:hypothetical protein n=1 Tax=Xaviernesmea rhizosphaerae TaxID=1672749 RepID=UPI00111A66F6|nr:hypothetical protein [Xaviernesmea rhizosphaerae]